MNNNEPCLFGIKAIGDDTYYTRIEIFPGNLYELFLKLDLSMIIFKDYITITFDGIEGFKESGLISVKIYRDGNKNEPISDALLLCSDSQIMFEVLNEGVAISTEKGHLDGFLDEQSSIILSKNQLGKSKEVTIRAILRSISLKIEVNTQYNTIDVANEDEPDFTLHEGATITLTVKNTGDRIEHNLIVLAHIISPILEFIQGSTNIVSSEEKYDFKNDSSDCIIKEEGLNIGDLRPGDEVIVDFDVKLSSIPSEDNESLPVYIDVRTEKSGFWKDETHLDSKSLEKAYKKQ